VNLTGVFLTCKHGIAALLRAGGGTVTCTASPTSLFGLAAGFTAYSSSKGGVYALVRVLANDYGRHGIRVNAVIPGFTETPLVEAVFDDPAALESRLASIPLGRPGTAEEVASMMVFVASDEASYATGAAFVVDGGLTAV
jgi:NAD(P)-dependent dehydrogenase (short-subunit alcohol dehydrogenase family)